jgi:hypothetical protein
MVIGALRGAATATASVQKLLPSEKTWAELDKLLRRTPSRRTKEHP